jgi:hypothetical protein
MRADVEVGEETAEHVRARDVGVDAEGLELVHDLRRLAVTRAVDAAEEQRAGLE